MRVDSGIYRCSANNSVSSNSTIINITVQCKLHFIPTACLCIFLLFFIVVAPEIIIPPDDTTVINGSETVMNCTVVGNPLPSISWSVISGVNISLLRSNGLMIPFDQQGVIDNMVVESINLNTTTIQSSLVLPETVSFIAGDYTCKASNILGSINRTAILTVHGMYTSNNYGIEQT